MENKEFQLGKQTEYKSQYDSSLLRREERSINRDRYGIVSSLFFGYDVWVAYEFSHLFDTGVPRNYIVKIVYPSSSKYIVESKSLKLYLNSFNQTKLSNLPTSDIYAVIKKDLEILLETQVSLYFYQTKDSEFRIRYTPFEGYYFLPLDILEKTHIKSFVEDSLLLSKKNDDYVSSQQPFCIWTDLLRSNCKVTHQPDWGNLFIKIQTEKPFSYKNFLEYVISFRNENHFHEEVVEMIYKRLWETFTPTGLMVCAMYTRRGGIEINPIRYNDAEFLTDDERILFYSDILHLPSFRQ